MNPLALRPGRAASTSGRGIACTRTGWSLTVTTIASDGSGEMVQPSKAWLARNLASGAGRSRKMIRVSSAAGAEGTPSGTG